MKFREHEFRPLHIVARAAKGVDLVPEFPPVDFGTLPEAFGVPVDLAAKLSAGRFAIEKIGHRLCDPAVRDIAERLIGPRLLASADAPKMFHRQLHADAVALAHRQ